MLLASTTTAITTVAAAASQAHRLPLSLHHTLVVVVRGNR
jgi:hypothetical protein